jgi:hypothetical protein
LARRKKEGAQLKNAMPADGLITTRSTLEDFGMSRLWAARCRLRDLTWRRKRPMRIPTKITMSGCGKP